MLYLCEWVDIFVVQVVYSFSIWVFRACLLVLSVNCVQPLCTVEKGHGGTLDIKPSSRKTAILQMD